jgi:ribosome biogenesis GTPase
VVLVTKMDLLDLAEDREVMLEEARGAAGSAAVIGVSRERAEGLDEIRRLLAPSPLPLSPEGRGRLEHAQGRTAIFVGASGAGKSTLVNALVGAEVQATEQVRAKDARGRHRTTARRLFVVPGGGAVIDGPGVRELKLFDPSGIEAAYEDVAEVAAGCRFRDCRHEDEPGCAVREAIEEGRIDAERVAGLRKLEAEASAAAARHGGPAAQDAKGRARAQSRGLRRFYEEEGEG